MWGRVYWPVWLVLVALSLLVPECYALFTGTANTLSSWIWGVLHVRSGQSPLDWSAARLLTFGAWCVLVWWLTMHFWFHLYR